MHGISSKAAGSLENRRKFNEGTELNSDFDVNWYETNYRSLDPQLGRFWQVDPMADMAFGYSPFAYGNNNPLTFNDPLGLFADPPETSTPLKPKVLEGVTVVGVRKKPPVDQQVVNWFTGADVGYSGSGWGHGPRRWVADQIGLTGYANNIAELGLHSQLQSGQVTLGGQLMEKVKSDEAMVKLQNNIIKILKADPRFGKIGFVRANSEVVEFGGQRAAGDMVEQIKDPLNPKYKDTWEVAANELTWALRHATVRYTALAKADGTIVIGYKLNDTFDLSAQGGRSGAYNKVSEITGFMYHQVAGGNANLQVTANWQTTIK